MRKTGSGQPPRLKTLRPHHETRPALVSDAKIARKSAARETLSADSRQLFAAEASELLDMFRSGHHDVVRVVDFFTKYPDLAAEAIKRSNSAVFHRTIRTTDLENAILRLGDFELYDIVFRSLAKQDRR